MTHISAKAAKKAIIYCRVSDKKQKHDGDGLQSQEHRCREYAASRGYVVIKTFHDDVSGGGDFMNRPGMVALLEFLERQTDDGYVVIFDDLKRFARDTIFHLKLRQQFSAYNAIIECLNFKIEDTPEGHFIETVIAAQGQLERQQNRRQTLQKMKARIERGYYCFARPIGYRYEKVGAHGRMLVRNEPVASIVQEALEGYASGRFGMQAEVKRFLDLQPGFPKSGKGFVRLQDVTRILSRPVYAGMVGAPNWGVKLRKGHHEPLISFATFQKIQDLLHGRARVPARQDLNADFPLRGFILCGHCSIAMTACWSKGCRRRYAYYLCSQRGCAGYGKSIPRERLEGEFEQLLNTLTPTEELFQLGCAVFKDLWDDRLANVAQRENELKAELEQTQRNVEHFLTRIADTNIPSIIGTYEERIRSLENQKLLLQERIANCGRPAGAFEYTLRTALDFLQNPIKLWNSERLEDKRTVLKLVFPDPLAYVREEGLRTTVPALPFKLLADLKEGKIEMARPERFELPTPWFVARYSIQLSYGRVLDGGDGEGDSAQSANQSQVPDNKEK